VFRERTGTVFSLMFFSGNGVPCRPIVLVGTLVLEFLQILFSNSDEADNEASSYTYYFIVCYTIHYIFTLAHALQALSDPYGQSTCLL